MMVEKAKEPTGNNFVFICNEKMWYDVQTVLAEWLASFKTCGTYLWSKKANGYVDVGATFNSYQIGGNTLSFKVDRAFSREYGSEKGYGLMLDLTADKTTGEPAILSNIWVAAA